MTRQRLPWHRRVTSPPRMSLTHRDVQVILAVYEYRVLRRDQIQQLFFPSKNTTNERLKRLYQHGFLERRWLPVEYGQGTSQALYLLGKRGANLVARELGIDHQDIRWKASHNHVTSLFLEHKLVLNQVRIAFTLAAHGAGYLIEKWITEEELKATPDYVHIKTAGGALRRVAVIPDGYFVLNLGDRRAHFCLEVDRATMANKRWKRRVQAYTAYVETGQYTHRFATRSLRVLTVTTGRKRLGNLKRTTEDAGGGPMFWFTTLERAGASRVLAAQIWQVARLEGSSCLVG